MAAFVYVLLLDRGEPLTPQSALVAQQEVLDALDAPKGQGLRALMMKQPRKPIPTWSAEQIDQLRAMFGDKTVDMELGILEVQRILTPPTTAQYYVN